MAAAARRDGRERDVAAFDEGDLWCSDEAEPALNPAGWYFRPRRGSAPSWIGPYDSKDDAAAASFSGDALRDARRRLDDWRRGDTPSPTAPMPVPPLPLAVIQPASRPAPVSAPATLPAQPQLELQLDGEAESSAPPRPRERRRKRATAEQIMFGF